MFRTEHDREAVAGEVRAHMARKRITAATLSESTDIPPATLSRKLNALSSFTVDELLRVARALDVDPAALLAVAVADLGKESA